MNQAQLIEFLRNSKNFHFRLKKVTFEGYLVFLLLIMVIKLRMHKDLW
jgi:hypothetical protein